LGEPVLQLVTAGLAGQFLAQLDWVGVGGDQLLEFTAVLEQHLLQLALQEETHAQVKHRQQAGHQHHQNAGIPEGELEAERACQALDAGRHAGFRFRQPSGRSPCRESSG